MILGPLSREKNKHRYISIIHNGPEVEMHSVSGECIENKILHGD